jgi:hypothetical protein
VLGIDPVARVVLLRRLAGIAEWFLAFAHSLAAARASEPVSEARAHEQRRWPRFCRRSLPNRRINAIDVKPKEKPHAQIDANFSRQANCDRNER